LISWLLLEGVVGAEIMGVVEALAGTEPVGHHRQELHLQKHLVAVLRLSLLYR
jgi:hypothetical protein